MQGHPHLRGLDLTPPAKSLGPDGDGFGGVILPATVPTENTISVEAPETLSEFLDQTVTGFSEPCSVQRQIL